MQHSVSGTSEEFWGFSDLHSPPLLSSSQRRVSTLSSSFNVSLISISITHPEYRRAMPRKIQDIFMLSRMKQGCCTYSASSSMCDKHPGHNCPLPWNDVASVCVCVALCLLLHSGSCGDNRVDNGIIITRAPILGGTIGNVCFDIGTHCTLGLSLNMHFFKFCI